MKKYGKITNGCSLYYLSVPDMNDWTKMTINVKKYKPEHNWKNHVVSLNESDLKILLVAIKEIFTNKRSSTVESYKFRITCQYPSWIGTVKTVRKGDIEHREYNHFQNENEAKKIVKSIRDIVQDYLFEDPKHKK